jgi:hypothetical protein
MSKPYFIWLGSGRTKRRKVAGPARWLDEATRARLPVATGAVLLDEFRQFCLEKELAVQSNRKVIIPDPTLLHNTLFYSIHLPRFDAPVRLRPTYANAQPDNAQSFAPFDSSDPDALARALAAAWSPDASSPDRRADVYLLEEIDANLLGSALTAGNSVVDDVWLNGDTSAGERISLPRLGRWQRPDENAPAHFGRLQQLLRGLRRTLDRAGWTITWADDGSVCFLTGIYAELPLPGNVAP